MPDFNWEAFDQRGQMLRGTHAATTVAEVVVHLRKARLSPVKIEEARLQSVSLIPEGKRKKGPIKPVDIQAMTSELAIMVRAGLSLDSALKVLVEMSYKQSVQEMLQAILESVKGGVSLSQALSTFGEHFGDFYINMIRSGEVSGQMAAVLQRLTEHMQRQRALRESAISATIYPAILLGVAVLSLVAMLGFVVPQFEQLFRDMGDALPLPTQLVMALGQAFREYGWLILLLCIASAVLLKRWMHSAQGRSKIQSWLLGLPVIGGVLHKYELTLFSRSLGTLLGNGVSLLTALRIATQTVNNLVIRQQLDQMIPMVKEGQRLVVAAKKATVFEPLALNLIRVGEETGRLGEMMVELSDILNRDVENGIKRLLTMLEPVLILVLGMLIAGIIVSILLGILSVNDLAV
jgi:general secretion pathway protein F